MRHLCKVHTFKIGSYQISSIKEQRQRRKSEGFSGSEWRSVKNLALGIITWVMWEKSSLAVGEGLLPRAESVALLLILSEQFPLPSFFQASGIGRQILTSAVLLEGQEPCCVSSALFLCDRPPSEACSGLGLEETRFMGLDMRLRREVPSKLMGKGRKNKWA